MNPLTCGNTSEALNPNPNEFALTVEVSARTKTGFVRTILLPIRESYLAILTKNRLSVTSGVKSLQSAADSHIPWISTAGGLTTKSGTVKVKLVVSSDII